MHAYLSSASSGARRALTAPAELCVRVLFYLVILVVLVALWGAATDAKGGEIVGYSFVAFAWYLMVAEAAVIGTKPRLIEQIGADISTGTVATEMLRPISVVWWRIASELGQAGVRMLCALLAGVAFISAVAGPPPSTRAAALAPASMVLAVTCLVVSQHLFGAISFWLGDAKSAWYLFQKLVFLTGGMLLPLQIFPSWLQALSWALPFWTMAYAPARLASGHFEPWILAAQLAWLLVLTAATGAAFAAGQRRLQLGGG
jgi:ABC-2 type transport system permease protein